MGVGLAFTRARATLCFFEGPERTSLVYNLFLIRFVEGLVAGLLGCSAAGGSSDVEETQHYSVEGTS